MRPPACAPPDPTRASGDHSAAVNRLSVLNVTEPSHLYLHNVNRDQERFVGDFGERVLPALADLLR